MARIPSSKRAKRTPPTLADQLYPEDGAQDASPDDKEEADAPEQTGATRTPMQKAADSLYPQTGRDDAEDEGGNDAGETEPDADDSDGADRGDDGGTEDDAADDDEEPAQGESGPAAQTGADRVHAVLGMFGVKGEPGSKEAEAMAKLEAGVRKAIADAEASKGAPLTPDEEQNVTGEYIADHAMKWLRLNKHDPDKMVKDMLAGVGNPKYKGRCATRFREAFEAAKGDSRGHPVSAKDWGPTLEKNGYERVSPENYVPQNGDVRVISGVPPKDPKHPTPGEKYGHIEVYDAEHHQWVSERKEQGDGIAQMYKDRHATVTVYRFNPF